uniref:Class I SAM-dependent methyltransferase n=1 Tax=Ignavibacterium album TaxID=591197 RepID=A0A7V2ZHR2_9BACT
MDREFWNSRYSEDHFIYGVEPNEFFKQQIDLLDTGKLFLPGEGEGRNAVYAASKGWIVDAVDFSEAAKNKALKLAESKSVKINYFISDLAKYNYPTNEYDLVGLFFVHLSPSIRDLVHSKIIKSLKSGGRIILEAFNKNQINNDSGGPKDIQLLYDEKVILKSFSELLRNSTGEILLLKNTTIELSEGDYHKGKADVIRFIGLKK